MNNDARQDDALYVGYLPAPAAHARFVRTLYAVLILCVIALGSAFALSMRDPGDAVWSSSRAREWRGVMVAAPYPMLLPDGQNGGRPLLIVELGKFGADRRAAPHVGNYVQLRGWLLERDGRQMIELVPEADAITPLGVAHVRVDASPTAHVVIRGEIVDAKCYYGAMKPGDGKGHKACAALCIGNGLPPILVATDERGARRYILLTDGRGDSARDAVLEFVGEPVEVRGALRARHGVETLAIDDGGVRRR